MKLTYEELINDIKTLCLSHKQVNAFDSGSNLYKKLKEVSYNYPLSFLLDGKSTINGSNLDFSFTLLIMSKIKHSNVDELKTLSNCLTIGLDIIGELQYHNQDYFLVFDDIKFTSFSDSFLDNVAGWQFEFVIRTTENWNSCIAPFDK
jgi:hypothetical protein